MRNEPTDFNPEDFALRFSQALSGEVAEQGDAIAVAVLYRGVVPDPACQSAPVPGAVLLSFEIQVSAPDIEAASDAARILFDNYATFAPKHVRCLDLYMMLPSSAPGSPRLLPREAKQPNRIAACGLNLWVCKLEAILPGEE